MERQVSEREREEISLVISKLTLGVINQSLAVMFNRNMYSAGNYRNGRDPFSEFFKKMQRYVER